ncbi:MAG: glycosyltransferase [Promethearchaeota archaeon]
MRIGLYGGLANNMYVFAKAMAKHGLDVCFIRDRGDRFPFSQPVWQDVSCTLDHDKIATAVHWTWEEWTDWEIQLGWQPPDWLKDPLKEFGRREAVSKNIVGPIDKAIFNILARRQNHWPAVLHLMTSCDILLVSGVEGSILALMAGKPFVIWPHGGDIRTAARLHPPQSHNLSTWLDYLMRIRILRLAYKKALWIGTRSPIASGYLVGDTMSQFKDCRFEELSLPIQTRPYNPKDKRHDLLSDVMTRLGLPVPRAELIGFVPSRVDFFWKGQDILFRSLLRLPNQGKIHLIVSGWGKDYENAQKMVTANQVTFIPCVVSKPILYDFYQAADFVADQFLIGYYGMAAVEAMSCGTPVMMWIKEQSYHRRGWESPPVLNVQNEEDIIATLIDILSGKIDLNVYGRSAYAWVQRVHGEDTVIPQLANQFLAALPNFS